MNATEAARRLGLHPQTVLRYARQRQILARKEAGEWVIPDEEVTRLERELSDYQRQHGGRLEAVELVIEHVGRARGEALAEARAQCSEYLNLAADYEARTRAGVEPQIAEDLARLMVRQITKLATIHRRLEVLALGQQAAYEAVPMTPRSELFQLSVRAGIEPKEARDLIGRLSDAEVSERLRGLRESAETQPAEAGRSEV